MKIIPIFFLLLIAMSQSLLAADPPVLNHEGPFKKVVLLGDTQVTSKYELALGREYNLAETEALIRHVANENPQFIGILGDATFDGTISRLWDIYDKFMEPVKNIKKYLVMGNHEYKFVANIFASDKTGLLTNIYPRFPELGQSHWYAIRQGGLVFLGLDTNRAKVEKVNEYFNKGTFLDQKNWLLNSVKTFSNDPTVKGIVVIGHHPPYTNTDLAGEGDDLNVQELLEPLSSVPNSKFMAYISGHTHGYEHFLQNGINYIVSGGGGGPRVNYLPPEKERHTDLFTGPKPRPFNYLVLEDDNENLKITVKGFDKNQGQNLKTLETINIKWK